MPKVIIFAQAAAMGSAAGAGPAATGVVAAAATAGFSVSVTVPLAGASLPGTAAAFPAAATAGGVGGFMCGGGVCFSFSSTWRIRAMSVGFPGLGPWTTMIPGFLSLSFLPVLFSMLAISCGMSSDIAFQYCLSAPLWNFSWLDRKS
jgi:hypothetical protein